MEVSNLCIAKIKAFEGFRSHAYKCAAGVWTCGYGHTKGVKSGDSCSVAKANVWLAEDLAAIYGELGKLRFDWTQPKFDAVVDFCYNCGASAFLKSTLCKLILQGSPRVAIEKEFRKWVHGGGKVLPGLVARRAWETERFYQ